MITRALYISCYHRNIQIITETAGTYALIASFPHNRKLEIEVEKVFTHRPLERRVGSKM